MKINIVIDNKKSWYQPYGEVLDSMMRSKGYDSKILSSQELIEGGTDVTFFLSCEKFVTRETRRKSRFNIVIHASDLPEGKGMSPSTWQILEGKNEITLTLFEVADKFDAGDYYLKDKVILDGTELIDEWQEKLGKKLNAMALYFVSQFGKLKPLKQSGQGTVYRRRNESDSELDPRKTIAEQFNLLRVVDNERYPAFFRMAGNKYIIQIRKSTPKGYLRKADKKDARILFDWRNDPLTRAQSINTDPVLLEDHLLWLENSLKNENRNIFIFEENATPAGNCRVDRQQKDGGEVFELSWIVAPEWRGKGIGKKMVTALIDEPMLQGKKLIAKIKKDNIASIKIAESVGFKQVSNESEINWWERKSSKD